MRILLLILPIFLLFPAMAEEIQTLYWDDLLPEGELERLEKLYESQSPMTFGHFDDGSMFPGKPVQIGTFNVVEDLDGMKVRVPGFVLPFEYTGGGSLKEFLLVPYFGACIHTPPPPPNQIVYVTAEKPAEIEKTWQPIWAIGTMRTDPNYNELGNSAYTLELESWETYDEE